MQLIGPDWATGGLEEQYYLLEHVRQEHGFTLDDCQGIDAPTMILSGSVESWFIGDMVQSMEFRDE